MKNVRLLPPPLLALLSSAALLGFIGCGESATPPAGGPDATVADAPPSNPEPPTCDDGGTVASIGVGSNRMCVLECSGEVSCSRVQSNMRTPMTRQTDTDSAPLFVELEVFRGASVAVGDLLARTQDGRAFLQRSDGEWVDTGLRNVVELDAGDSHACARTDAGLLHCLGANFFGNVSILLEPGEVPAGIVEEMALFRDEPVAGFATGGHATCVSNTDGTVQCTPMAFDRADNPINRLIDAPTLADSVRVVMGGTEPTTGTCGVMTDDSVVCLGELVAPARTGSAIAVTETGLCFTEQGEVRCNGIREARAGNPEVALEPSVPTPAVRLASASNFRFCAQAADDTVSCWGSVEEDGEYWTDVPVQIWPAR